MTLRVGCCGVATGTYCCVFDSSTVEDEDGFVSAMGAGSKASASFCYGSAVESGLDGMKSLRSARAVTLKSVKEVTG